MAYLLGAVGVALAFPLVVLAVHESGQRRRNRRAGRRKTQKLRL